MDYPCIAVVPIYQGKLVLSQSQLKRINDYKKKHEGQDIRITLSQPTKGRSLNQNSYMWGVVYEMIASETGHSTEEIHEYMKAMFLPRHFIRIGKGNKEQQLTKSTTTLSTFEMEEYLERVRAFAATELSMRIPLPHET